MKANSLEKKAYTESMFIKHGKVGEVYYSNKDDKNITAIASFYKRNVVTQRVLMVEYTLDIPVTNNCVKIVLGEFK